MSIARNSFAFLLLITLACGKKTPQKSTLLFPAEGNWRMTMQLEKGEHLPFNFELKKNQSIWQMTIHNAEEEINLNQLIHRNDSLLIQFPVFESNFALSIDDSTSLSGVWVNNYKSDDYKIPVKAKWNEIHRFIPKDIQAKHRLSKKYRCLFDENTTDSFEAIGLFKQKGNRVYGTFATETGDYRYLEGNLVEDSIFLSTFDGSHAFLFKAQISGDSLNGIFWSGTHYKVNWKAVADSTFELRNPDSLTFLKEGYASLSFTLPNIDEKMVSLSDQAFNNKVVIVQIMGTWCPNCLDETKYLSKLYDQYKNNGLEVIALAFERTKTKEKAFSNLRALKQRTNAQYTLLLGGSNRKETPLQVLPMLNHIMSYPTAIFIDKNGKVRKIHTGFYGPGTGKYYRNFTHETEAFVKQLLEE